MALTKEKYKERLIDKKITEYLNIFGALSIDGPKWCGKTWTSLNHANSVKYIEDDENDKKIAELDVSEILKGDTPHLIDEWQLVPSIWDAVRRECDKDDSTGKYISKIYMRNNLNENFTDDLTEDIKNGEEKEVEYGNYSPLYSWDMKFVFADGTEKALNSMLAANQLYNEATLELVELGDNIDAVNHDMATFDAEIPAETAETAETTEPAQTEENTEESNPGNEEAEVESTDETTPTTEETVENEEVSGETENAEENTEETTEETAEEAN